jgi:hypothetical protein
MRNRVKSADRLDAFAVALALIATANCALFLYFMEKASIRVPVCDMLDWLQFYGDHLATGDWLGYLWTPHNEHRIVFARILLSLDVRWFGGEGTAFVLFGLILLLGMAAAIGREVVKSDLPRSWTLAAFALTILLLTPTYIVETLGMPIMSVFLQTAAFALFSVVLLDGEKERSGNLRRLAAIVAACLSSFGVAGGLVIWPVLIWAAWRARLRLVWIAVLGCAGTLWIAVYLWHLPVNSVSTPYNFDRLVLAFDYAVRFLGLPWSHLHLLVWPSRLIGFGILVLGSFALMRESFSAHPGTRLQQLGLAMVLFSFLVAGAAALARVDTGVDREMPIRYGMFMVLAQIGLLLWSLEYLQQFSARTEGRALQWIPVGISMVWLGQQVVAGNFTIAEANRYNDAWARFVSGQWTPDMLHYVYPDPAQARAGLARLREMGLYKDE